jgi:outer membrane protein assembly factor BamB
MRYWCLILVAVLLSLGVSRADNWPNWRGPNFNGVADGKGYPTEWSATKNVVWKVSLPGRGASTPIVWNDRIFLTCGIDGRNAIVALDRNGKQLWQTLLGDERAGKHKKATGSNPSVTTDGKHVFAYFKSGDLACLDFGGQVLWRHNLQDTYGEDTLWWDLGTSPVLTNEHVVVAVMQSGFSYLAAFDKATGKLAWKQDRLLEAPREAAQSYSTPVVTEHQGRQILVVLGADHVTAHDAATGAEIWRVGGLNPEGQEFFRSIASPVIEQGIVVAPYARGKTITAIRLGGKGDVTKTHVAWTRDGIGADVPTPAAVDGKVYLCMDKGEVACLDIQTGKTLWQGQVEKNRNAYSSSPIVADGNIYITREDGKTFVLAQGDEFKVLAENELEGEFVVATPVFADGRILIRTFENLLCIGH